MSTNTALDQIKNRVEGHTEGPWVIAADPTAWESEEGGFDVGPDDAPTVAVVEGLADAELIAAAPKLLAAIEAVEAELALAERTFTGFADEDLMVRGVCVSIHNAIEEALR